MDNSGISGITIFLAILAPVVGLIGVTVGQWGLRGREVRETRRQSYVDWLQATVQLAAVDDAAAAQGSVTIPTLAAIATLNHCTMELNVVGSVPVLRLAQEFLALMDSPEYTTAMSGPVANVREAMMRHGELTRELRSKVVSAMRKDVLPWWMPGSRDVDV